jgi:hypothetical protein
MSLFLPKTHSKLFSLLQGVLVSSYRENLDNSFDKIFKEAYKNYQLNLRFIKFFLSSTL